MYLMDFAPSVRTVNRKPATERAFRPAANILDSADSYRIQLVLPGFSKEDLNVSLEKNLLEVSGNPTVGEEKTSYRRIEFRPRAFSRRFELPEDVDRENLTATYEQGILEVRLPKVPEAKPRHIEVA